MIEAELQAALLTWYQTHQRALPWRDQPDPYKIWLSEVMLQQTQVATVIPYYERFLTRFPTLQALAAAPLDEVLKAWEGLGYYSRAANLHRAARRIVAEGDGQFPRTAQALQKLPGFGPYTAGAVASIAFGEAVPAVDGNVKRVLSRLFAIEADIASAEGLAQINAVAARLAQSAPAPAQWTQALMELGATICTPTKPRCLLCPAGPLCRAKELGLEAQLPRRRKKKPIPHFDVTAAVIYKDETRREFLIARRPPTGMLAGLWEFPGGKVEPGEALADCLRREIREELAMEIAVAEPVVAVKHAFTHFKITLHAFAAYWLSGEPQKLGVADWRWTNLAELDGFAFGKTDRRVIEVLRQLTLQLPSKPGPAG